MTTKYPAPTPQTLIDAFGHCQTNATGFWHRADACHYCLSLDTPLEGNPLAECRHCHELVCQSCAVNWSDDVNEGSRPVATCRACYEAEWAGDRSDDALYEDR